MFYLPSLKMSDTNLKQEQDGELKPVNYFIIDGGYFLTKNDGFKFIDMEHLNGFKWQGNNDYFDIELGDEHKLLNLKIEDTNWKTTIKDDKIYVDIKVISKINYNHTEYTPSEIEEMLIHYVKKDILDTYQRNYKDIDIYWFNDLSYRTNKKIESEETFNLNITTTLKNSIYEY
jgi:hypothetical protein